MVYFTEYPWPTLCGTAYHDGIGAGVIQYEFGFFWRSDVAVGDYGDGDGGANVADGLVLGLTFVVATVAFAATVMLVRVSGPVR